MAKQRDVYKCTACGVTSLQWKGQCPSCGEWNTLELLRQNTSTRLPDAPAAVPLARVSDSEHEPYKSGIGALDRVLGPGLVPGAAILIGGEPGIGKSTLLLQVAQAVAAQGKQTLYASGEESLTQIKSRAERLGALSPNLLAMATSQVESVLAQLEGPKPPALLVVDSVQTMTCMLADGLPGNVNQVRAVATTLLEACKRSDTTLVLVGHVTKDGTLAGPRLLEHMVDTVIALEGDRRQMFRLLRVFKNRFGPNEELLVFRMGSRGMEIIDDPSTFFLGARDPSLSGAAVAMALDGRRPLAVEVQALASRTFLSIPRRTALGIDVNRLHLLLAVLEKRLKLNFGQLDIYAKIGGGIKLSDPGLDLALSAAILSSYYDIPLPEKSVFWGEVDLNGQIRPVAGDKLRLAQANRLGFSPIFCPEDDHHGGLVAIADLGRKLFGKNRNKDNES